MAIDFPDTTQVNPDTGLVWADGDTYLDIPTGLRYYWYAPVWKRELQVTGPTDEKYVERDGDNMTGNLTLGPDDGDSKITLDASDGKAEFSGIVEANSGLEAYIPTNNVQSFSQRWFDNKYGTRDNVASMSVGGSFWVKQGVAVGEYSNAAVVINSAGQIIASTAVFSGDVGFGPNSAGSSEANLNGAYIGSTGYLTLYHNSTNTSDFFTCRRYGVTDPVAKIGYDGSAEFKGAGKQTFQIRPTLDDDSGGYALRLLSSDNDTHFEVNGNGSAKFSGTVIGGTYSCNAFLPNLIRVGDGFNDKQYAFYATNGAQSALNIGLALDGSAEFTGNVEVGPYDIGSNSDGVYLSATGGIISQRNTAFAAAATQFAGYYGTVPTFTVNVDGSAVFGQTPNNANATGVGILDAGGAIAVQADGKLFRGHAYSNGAETSSITDAGKVTCNHVTAEQYFETPGQGFFAYTTEATQGLFIGKLGSTGVIENDYNASITGAGAATLKGDIQSGGRPGTGTPGVRMFASGLVDSCNANGTYAVWRGLTQGSTQETSRINANGSATFLGQVTVGEPFGTSKKGAAVGPDGYVSIAHTSRGAANCFTIYDSTSEKSVVEFQGDGTAEFQGPVSSTRSSDSQSCFEGYKSGTTGTTSKIKADGSSEFKGRLDVAPDGTATNKDYVSLYANGAVGVRRNSGSNSDYIWTGISGTTETSRINKDGSASFCSQKIRLENDNFYLASAVIPSTTAADAYPVLWRGNTGRFHRDPNAARKFLLSTRCILDLEPDNPNNYTTTTDNEGVEITEYTGPTLDVKDRLQKTKTALETLRTATTTASNFDDLKSAILTALADI